MSKDGGDGFTREPYSDVSRELLEDYSSLLSRLKRERPVTRPYYSDDLSEFAEKIDKQFRSGILNSLEERIIALFEDRPRLTGTPDEIKESEYEMAREFIKLGLEFILAARRGVIDKVEKFIALNFPVDFQDPRTLETALHCASGSGARSTFDILIATGECNYLIKDRRGMLPSDRSCLFHGSEEMTETLIQEEIKQANRQRVGPEFFRPKY